MNLDRFEDTIKSLFPEELLSEFHNDYGFTSCVKNEIKRVGYCTNLSLEAIELAAAQNVDLLLTHHDAWDFLYGLRDVCMEKLKEYNMSHFYIHGPLDYVEFGTCTSLMNELEINNIIQLSIYDEGDIPGIGELTEPQSFEVLTVKTTLTLNEHVRAWKHHDRPVKRIGMVTGAGHSSNTIKKAVDAGCDTYITGEATLYSIQYAQFAGINLIAGSHTFTEIFGVESLAKKIKEQHEEISIVRIEESHFEAR
ncbi:Nif3-like dinuclear metal center hexameric protein [Fictibacillus sp. FJAT-27399]|uniref:Nif3-like dinuclear metal center hexameric protein n=1 Tax=Fictibacillus sp. FJAT-27399 TaxID=1729689 RepID=UPI00078348B4|nr:Nif3-like dinuclear metal center hexameric protein [Fictibacillus sp. FJAT-27399]